MGLAADAVQRPTASHAKIAEPGSHLVVGARIPQFGSVGKVPLDPHAIHSLHETRGAPASGSKAVGPCDFLHVTPC
jgi:hypothetical protein